MAGTDFVGYVIERNIFLPRIWFSTISLSKTLCLVLLKCYCSMIKSWQEKKIFFFFFSGLLVISGSPYVRYNTCKRPWIQNTACPPPLWRLNPSLTCFLPAEGSIFLVPRVCALPWWDGIKQSLVCIPTIPALIHVLPCHGWHTSVS